MEQDGDFCYSLFKEGEQQPWKKLAETDFDFIKLLGEGGYGSVFLASKKSNGQQVAIKIINKAKLFEVSDGR